MRKDTSLIALILFPFLPFLSFLIACANLKGRVNGIVFVLFYGLFGYCHTFEDIRVDSYRKMLEFGSSTHTSFNDIMREYLDGDKMDIYQTWLFSQISVYTNNPNIMMMVVGLIGGFFCLQLLRRIQNDYGGPLNMFICILIILMSIPISPVQMGGIRWFTGLSLFAYSVLRFVIDKKNIWIIPILCTPLIHYGFFIFVVSVIIVRIFPFKHNLFYWPVIVVCTASLFLNTSSWSGATNNLDTFIENDAISYRANHYADSETDADFNESLTNRILSIQNKIVACYIVILLINLRYRWHTLNISNYSQRVYNYTLFFLLVGFTFITFSVVGQRYLYLALILLGHCLLNLYKENNNSFIKFYISIIPIVFIGYIAWTIYNSYISTGINIYIKTLPQLLL